MTDIPVVALSLLYVLIVCEKIVEARVLPADKVRARQGRGRRARIASSRIGR